MNAAILSPILTATALQLTTAFLCETLSLLVRGFAIKTSMRLKLR